MKYLAIILSIYTFYMISTPCADEAFPGNNRVHGQAQQQVPPASAGHADCCSPFCICSCCSVPVTITPATFIGQPYFFFRQPSLVEASHFISYFIVSFWQPPKIR
jgi:hypothetical protein